MKTAFKAAIYARVSTGGQTVDPQLDALRGYAEARGLAVVGEYVDHGVSGAKARRPALDAMMAAARKRKIDAVVCVKLDRLARSVRHLTALGAEFEALGVDLVVVDQSIDTSTPSGRFLFHTLGAVAELERDLIRERTRSGLAAARRRGMRLGRPRALDRQGVARARRLVKRGRPVRDIAAMLGCSVATVRRVLAAS
jgi:DNA invertase Pin-like site-specific DNA recombinase